MGIIRYFSHHSHSADRTCTQAFAHRLQDIPAVLSNYLERCMLVVIRAVYTTSRLTGRTVKCTPTCVSACVSLTEHVQDPDLQLSGKSSPFLFHHLSLTLSHLARNQETSYERQRVQRNCNTLVLCTLDTQCVDLVIASIRKTYNHTVRLSHSNESSYMCVLFFWLPLSNNIINQWEPDGNS